MDDGEQLSSSVPRSNQRGVVVHWLCCARRVAAWHNGRLTLPAICGGVHPRLRKPAAAADAAATFSATAKPAATKPAASGASWRLQPASAEPACAAAATSAAEPASAESSAAEPIADAAAAESAAAEPASSQPAATESAAAQPAATHPAASEPAAAQPATSKPAAAQPAAAAVRRGDSFWSGALARPPWWRARRRVAGGAVAFIFAANAGVHGGGAVKRDQRASHVAGHQL